MSFFTPVQNRNNDNKVNNNNNNNVPEKRTSENVQKPIETIFLSRAILTVEKHPYFDRESTFFTEENLGKAVNCFQNHETFANELKERISTYSDFKWTIENYQSLFDDRKKVVDPIVKIINEQLSDNSDNSLHFYRLYPSSKTPGFLRFFNRQLEEFKARLHALSDSIEKRKEWTAESCMAYELTFKFITDLFFCPFLYVNMLSPFQQTIFASVINVFLLDKNPEEGLVKTFLVEDHQLNIKVGINYFEPYFFETSLNEKNMEEFITALKK